MSGAEAPSHILVLTCMPQDFDAETGVCSAPIYGPMPTLLPVLSIADGIQLTAAIASCWAIGFLIKEGRRPAKY